jgi:hypothetical protein
LIICGIGEKSIVWIAPASSQCTQARDEHPVVARSNQRHEKLWHLVSIADSIERFTIDKDCLSGYRLALISHGSSR